MLQLYIKKLIRESDTLIPGGLAAALALRIGFLLPFRQFATSGIAVFAILFPLGYAARRREFKKTQRLTKLIHSKYTLSASQEGLLEVIQEADPEVLKTLYQQMDEFEDEYDKKLIQDCIDLESDGYIKILRNNTGIYSLQTTTKGRKYLDKRLY